jgi:tetraacyldisaccharide 4'-kinase
MKRILGKTLAWAYGLVVRVWQVSYDWFPFRKKSVGAHVISVGNITWGGTGKTPLTVKLAQLLVQEGKKVAVLTRGYGLDEVQELRKKLPGIPVIVGRDRVRAAREAITKHGAQILILDDGFQHIRLRREVDIVTLNSTEPFGPGGLLPLGTLREPLENLSRADLFVLTKCNIGSKNVHWIRQKLNMLKPNAVIFEAIHQPLGFVDPLKKRRMELSAIRNRKVGALSGIGDPYSFEKTVEFHGADILFAARYEDHHSFRESELIHFVKQCRQLGIVDAITTEKDFFRIASILEKRSIEKWQDFTFWVLEIEFQINDEEDFIRRCLNS